MIHNLEGYRKHVNLLMYIYPPKMTIGHHSENQQKHISLVKVQRSGQKGSSFALNKSGVSAWNPY